MPARCLRLLWPPLGLVIEKRTYRSHLKLLHRTSTSHSSGQVGQPLRLNMQLQAALVALLASLGEAPGPRSDSDGTPQQRQEECTIAARLDAMCRAAPPGLGVMLLSPSVLSGLVAHVARDPSKRAAAAAAALALIQNHCGDGALGAAEQARTLQTEAVARAAARACIRAAAGGEPRFRYLPRRGRAVAVLAHR